ncbi:MAG: heavy-metal-associated domain-containing protein [Anaerolineae bacterium]
MTEAVLRVPSISCMHCVRRISQMLLGLEGVRKVSVDLESKSVTIESESVDTVERARAALAELGYPVEA